MVTHKYRADIDGLRAFAVGFVLLFHAWPQIFPSGFIGVDIFFVISGYLITGIIIRANFTFKDFYQRRILRIVPPLVATLALTVLLGLVLLTPEEYARLGEHIRSSAFFIGNFHLIGEDGYFDVAGTQKPLLHLWSLSVEEQFYIFFPILLIISQKFFKAFFTVLIIIGISLAYTAFIEAGTLRFYSPLTRAFELCCGGLACLIPKNPDYRNFAGWTGAILLLFSFFPQNTYSSWPNYYTLAPCFGTSLLLYSESSFVNSFFANKIFVFIGLISYELYLLHWPLLSIGFILTGGELNNLTKIILLLLAFILATISFLFFNRPIRQKFRNNYKIGLLLVSILALTGAAGHFIYLNNGFPKRVGETKDTSFEDQTRAFRAKGAAYFPNWKLWTDANQVMLEDAPELLDLALIGDSHAGHLFYGFHKFFPDKKIGVFPVGCQAPWPGVATFTSRCDEPRTNGYKLIIEAYETILKNENIKTVILAHNPNCSFGDSIDPMDPSNKNKTEIMKSAIRKGLSQLVSAGKNVIIVLDAPHLPFKPSKLHVRPYNRIIKDKDGFFPENKFESMTWYENLCRDVAKDFPNVHIIDLFDLFCEEGRCRSKNNGNVLYKDQNHLNNMGSQLATQYIINQLSELF